MSSAALEKLFIAELNTSHASLKPDLFSYESIFLDRIRPDPSNARFLPATFISNNDAASFTRRLLTKADLMAKYSVIRVSSHSRFPSTVFQCPAVLTDHEFYQRLDYVEKSR